MTNSNSNPYLSVVVPIYNEEQSLPVLFQRLTQALDKLNKTYEIIFVDDGSRDQSAKMLTELYEQHPQQVRVIFFNRNFGQHMAIMAAFEHVRGEVIVTLDADLQNPPEEIYKLLEKVDEGHDVVGGYRVNRQDSAWRKWASRLNNYIRFRITNIRMTDQGCMLRAYQRPVIDLMVSSAEAATFIPGLAYTLASNPAEVEVKHEARLAGESKYNLYRLLRLNFDLMTGFSLVPLQMFTISGLLLAIFSILFFVYLVLRRLIAGPEVEGVFTLFAILFFLAGIIMMGLGIIGEYIGRIYQEVRRRPRFIIKKILETQN
jgi:undecaprenyl-phosphate 4-deoxy-4-formamido-L-arabinose transferase